MKLYKLLFNVLTACLISSCSINDKIEDSGSISTESSNTEPSNIVDNQDDETIEVRNFFGDCEAIYYDVLFQCNTKKVQSKNDIAITIKIGHDGLFYQLVKDPNYGSLIDIDNVTFALVREINDINDEIVSNYIYYFDDFVSDDYNYTFITDKDTCEEEIRFKYSFVDYVDTTLVSIGSIAYYVVLIKDDEIINRHIAGGRQFLYFKTEQDMCKFSRYEKDIK